VYLYVEEWVSAHRMIMGEQHEKMAVKERLTQPISLLFLSFSLSFSLWYN
jgi:hypothetical protein